MNMMILKQKRIQAVEWMLAVGWILLHVIDVTISKLYQLAGGGEYGLIFAVQNGEITPQGFAIKVCLAVVVAGVILCHPKINTVRWLTILNVGMILIICAMTIFATHAFEQAWGKYL